ncbi:MAG TPA: methyltransferase domain-containing protein [Candidatus Hydrogenedentes bacterium]|nr:methyltransferase domain-containing protein [Candidatus Hydrogenedentota bacterium]
MSRMPRVLTFNFHEPYLCLMAKTGIPMDVGMYESGTLCRPWHESFRPLPPTLTLVPEAVWRERARTGQYDVIIAHNENNAIDVIHYRAARLLVLHNRRSFIVVNASAGGMDPARAHADLMDLLSARFDFIFISESKKADYGLPGRVIPPGVDGDIFNGYTGEAARVLRVGNLIAERTHMFDAPFQQAVLEGGPVGGPPLPCVTLGQNPAWPDSRPSASLEDLLEHYRRNRCLFHVTREEYEDGYNLSMLEAMATGMPVVALSNATSPVEDGVNGFHSLDPAILRHRLELLLRDREFATRLGKNARESVLDRFPISRFAKLWREAIEEAADQFLPATYRPRPLAPTIRNRMVVVCADGGVYDRAWAIAQALRREVPVWLAGYLVPDKGWPPQVTLADPPGWHALETVIPPGCEPRAIVHITSEPWTAPNPAEAFRCAYTARLLVHISPQRSDALPELPSAEAYERVLESNARVVQKSPLDRVHWFDPDADPAAIAREILRCLPPCRSAPPPVNQLLARGKDPFYYAAPRLELMPHVPVTVKKLLDVGCATGSFGHAVKTQFGNPLVFGIEMNPDAAEQARQKLDEVLMGDIEDIDLPETFRNFDCIVCADVLEHLRNPEVALRKLGDRLAPDGRIVISIPNVQFYEVIAMLASGNWTYTHAGIMDETHRHFFTRATLEDLLREAGLECLTIEPLSMATDHLFPLPADRSAHLGKITITNLTDADYQALRTYQYVVVATRKRERRRFEDALAAYENGRWQEACLLAGNAEDASPGERLLLMGRAMAKQGDYARAETYLREAIASGSREATGELGILLTGLSRFDEALPLLNDALAVNPDDDRCHAAAAILRLNRREPEAAWPHLARALTLSYAHTFLAGPLTEIALETGRAREAVEILTRLADYYPANFDLTCDLAVVLIQAERLEEARERLETVIMLCPDHERALALLNQLREVMG